VGDFLDTKYMVSEQHSIFTTLTLLLLAKGISFCGTTCESFRMALSMAVELPGSATMLTVTSLTWAKMTGMSSKERMIDMDKEDSMVMALCGTTTE